MSGPWERYQAANDQSGPWTRYQGAESDYSAQLDKLTGFSNVGPSPKIEPKPQSIADPAAMMMDQLTGAFQGTTPIVRDQGGSMLYRPIGDYAETDSGPSVITGPKQWRPVDPKAEVVLRDPLDGKMKVFARSEKSDEGPVTSFARLLGIGAMSSIPRGVANAASGGGMASAVKDFEQSKVPPSIAGTRDTRGMASLQAFLKDVPGAGTIVQRGIGRQLDAASARAQEIAGKYGQPASPYRTGAAIQAGVERFASGGEGATQNAASLPSRMTSFEAKSNALYDRVDELVPQMMRDTKVDMRGFLETLATQGKRIDSPGLAAALQNPTLKKWAETIAADGGALSWNDARLMRREVGKLLKDPQLRGNLDSAAVDRIYGAATNDMSRTAAAIDEMTASAYGKPVGALKAFQQADRFYRAGLQRINDSLTGIFKAKNPTDAYEQVLRAAGGRGAKADLGKIYQLQRSLRPEEWGDLSATIISRLGRTGEDAAEFSPQRFVTEYRNLTKPAKDALFSSAGNKELRSSLDTLFRVTDRLQKAEKLTNYSGSGRQMIWGGAMGAALYADPISTIGSIMGAAATAKLIMSPTFVRWLAKGAQMAEMNPSAIARHTATLGTVAKQAPEVGSEIQRLMQGLQSGHLGLAPAEDKPSRQ